MDQCERDPGDVGNNGGTGNELTGEGEEMTKHYVVFDRMKDSGHPWSLFHDEDGPAVFVFKDAADTLAKEIELFPHHGRPMQAHVAEVELP